MSEIGIQELAPAQRGDAARVLARAFVTNPLHIAAFGPSQIGTNEAFFRMGLDQMRGPKFVAVDAEARVVGVAHWVQAPRCQFSTRESLLMLPTVVKGVGFRSALRVRSWLSVWSKYDPGGHHLHLGPIGVAPELQGRHVGSRLMRRYCEELDRTKLFGYLETDRPENVEFYKRFGFEVTATETVLGVVNFFMTRKGRHGDT